MEFRAVRWRCEIAGAEMHIWAARRVDRWFLFQRRSRQPRRGDRAKKSILWLSLSISEAWTSEGPFHGTPLLPRQEQSTRRCMHRVESSLICQIYAYRARIGRGKSSWTCLQGNWYCLVTSWVPPQWWGNARPRCCQPTSMTESLILPRSYAEARQLRSNGAKYFKGLVILALHSHRLF